MVLMNTAVDKSPERVQRMFNAIAPRYDLINRLLTLGIDSQWRKKTARILLHNHSLKGDILDVCSGTGELAFAFGKQLQKGQLQKGQLPRTCFGIDFSQEMIAVAQRKEARKKSGNTNLYFSVADALKLPFDDNRFAVVAVAFGLRNIGNTEQGLDEMVRVCKPGGIVAVLEFSMPTLPIVRQCYRFYFRTFLPCLGQWFAKNQDKAYHYLPESVLQFDSPGQLAERLTQLGLADIQMKPMTCGIASLIWGRKP